MSISDAICFWFLFFSASLASNIVKSMARIITTKWNLMSRKKYPLIKYQLTKDQRKRIADRIRSAVKRRYKIDARFLEDYGLAPGTFGHWKTDGKLNVAFLMKFSKEFDVDLTWLLRGIDPEEFPKERLNLSRDSED